MMIRKTALILLLALPAFAQDGGLPIERALALVAERYQGRMIAAELDEDDDRPIYDFRWRTPQGNVLKIEMDAITGQFLEVEGVGQTEARILQ